jgi:predicted RNA-binding protein with PUA-like domain
METFRKIFEARKVKVDDIYHQYYKNIKKPTIVKVLKVSGKTAHVEDITANGGYKKYDIPTKILQDRWELHSYVGDF